MGKEAGLGQVEQKVDTDGAVRTWVRLRRSKLRLIATCTLLAALAKVCPSPLEMTLYFRKPKGAFALVLCPFCGHTMGLSIPSHTRCPKCGHYSVYGPHGPLHHLECDQSCTVCEFGFVPEAGCPVHDPDVMET